MNEYERAARSAKVQVLIAVITMDAVSASEGFLGKPFAEKLAAAGSDFWIAAALKAGCSAPSLTTQAEVIGFFRSCSMRAEAQVRP